MAEFKSTRRKKEESTASGFKSTRRVNPQAYSSLVYSNQNAYNALNDYAKRINKGEWLSTEDRAAYKSAIDTYTSSGNKLREVGKRYGATYTPEEDKSWLDSVNALNSGYTGINDFYNQFASDKVYGDWKKENDRYNSYVSMGSNVDINKANEGWKSYLDFSAKEKSTDDEEWWETLGRWLGGSGGITDSTLPMYETTQTIHNLRDDVSYMRPKDDWTQEQKNVFGQLFAESPDKAFKYAEEANYWNNKAKEEAEIKKIEELANQNGFTQLLHSLGSVGTSLLANADVLYDLALSNSGRDYTASQDGIISPYEYTQAVQSSVSQNLNNQLGTLPEDLWAIGGMGWGDVYSLAMSRAQSLVSGAIGGQATTLITFFGQGMASGYDDAKARGASDGEATLVGLLQGAFEGVSEMIGIDRLFKIKDSKTLGSLILNVLKQAGVEGLEEGATALFNAAVDNFVMQDHSNFAYDVAAYMNQGYSEAEAKSKAWSNSTGQIVSDFLGGALSGGLSGAASTGGQTINQNIIAKKYYGSQAQGLAKEAANSSDQATKALGAKMENKLKSGKELSGWNLNQLLDVTDTEKLNSAVAERLSTLGEKGDVKAIADAITKMAKGSELSSKEENLIKGSSFAKRVINELNEDNIKAGTHSSAWTESIGARRIGKGLYNQKLNTSVKTKDGAQTAIAKVVNAGDGEITVELADGTQTEAKNIAFNDEKAELVFKTATERVGRVEGWTTETANAMIKAYEDASDMTPESFAKGWTEAYDLGKVKGAESQLSVMPYARNLPEGVRTRAYSIGSALSEAKVVKNTNKGSFTFEDSVTPEMQRGFTKKQQNDVKALKIISEALGINVRVFDSPVNAEDKRVGENGSYDAKTRTLRVDLHAGENGGGLVAFTAAHELTHHMRAYAKDSFNSFADAVFKSLGEGGVNVQELVEARIDSLRKDGRLKGLDESQSYDLAYEEVVSDAAERMLADSDALAKLSDELKSKDKTLWQKVKDYISSLVKKIKDAYAKLNPDSYEGRKLKEVAKDYEEILKIWSEGLVKMSREEDATDNSEATIKYSGHRDDYSKPITKEDVDLLRSIGRKSINDFTANEIELAQKWAYKFYKELGVKSPFFRAWFGEWRAHQRSIFVDVQEMERREGKNPRGSYANTDTGWIINSSSVGYDETKAHSGKDKRSVIAMQNIDKIIKNSILLDTEISEPGRGKKSIYTAFMHKFYAPISIDGKHFIAKMAVDESYMPGQNDTNKKFYHVRAIEIETAPSVGIGKSHTPIMESTVSKYSISDLYDFVKTYDKDFSPAPTVSEAVLNEDGMPKVFYHGTNAKFTTFESGHKRTRGRLNFGEGYYFAADKSYAENYIEKDGRIIEAYISLKKPYFVVGNQFTEWEISDIRSKLPSEDGSRLNYDNINSYLKKLRYDGVVGLDYSGTTKTVRSVVAFDSAQIKSATDNIGTFSKSDKDIRYSDRLSADNSFSNRSLLANALESVAASPMEKQKLAEYKAKIRELNVQSRKLYEINQEIKELTFGNGKKNAERLKALREEATKTTNRINLYDKKLLDLEATKPLRDVLERETKKAYKAAAQKGREALHRNVEGRHKTEERHKIQRIAKELDALLNRGTKDKNVKKGASPLVRAALDVSDMLFATDDELIVNGVGTEYTTAEAEAMDEYVKLYEEYHSYDNSVSEHKERRAFLRSQMTDLKHSFEGVIERERQRINDTQAATMYDVLIKEYKKLEKAEEGYLKNAYDKDAAAHLEALKEKLGKTVVGDMTLEQLKDLYKAFKMVKTLVSNSNKLFRAEGNETVEKMGSEALGEIEAKGHKEKFNKLVKKAESFLGWENLKPIYLMERTGSKVLQKLFAKVLEGESVWATDMAEARKYAAEQKKAQGYKSWDFEKKTQFTSNTGKTFELSLGQMMSIYAYAKRGEQALEHLRTDGFVYDLTTESKKGMYELNDKTAYKVSDEVLIKILGSLSKEQKAYVDAMVKYLSETMGKKGNEVSNVLYGIDLFGEENYFPIRSEGAYLERVREQNKGESKIKNKGYTKPTTPHARNAIVLSDFGKVWSEHVAEMSSYHAFVLPMEDFYRVYNYQTKSDVDADKRGVIPALENAYSDNATKAIDQLLADLNGGARGDYREALGKSALSLYKAGKVMASMSVVVQQPSSIIRAMAMINPKYFTGSKIGETKRKALWEEMKQYAPVTLIKEMGHFDVGMGRASAEWLMAEEYEGIKEKAKALVLDSDYRNDVLSKPASVADEITWVSIWNAVKRETARENPTMNTSSEEFLKKAGARFEDVIRHTQVYDSTLARSGNMRAKSLYMQMLTAFMAEPTTSINMREMALRSGDKGRIAKTTAAVYGAALLNSVLVALPYAMRDDDEDETFAEKYITALSSSFLDSINPLNSLPFVKDVWSMAQGYSIDRMDASMADDLINSLKKIVTVASDEDREDGAIMGAIGDLVLNLSAFTGVPVQNIWRDIKSIINFGKTISRDIEGMETTWMSIGDAMEDMIRNETPILGWFKGETKGDKLYDALVAGESKYVARFRATYKDESKYLSAVRKALRENDPRMKEAAEAYLEGDYATYNAIRDEIVKEGVFERSLVTDALKAEINYLKEKNEGK